MFTRRDKKQLVDIVGLLGKGTSFEGKLYFEGTVRIDGEFSGEVSTEGLLIIGDEAIVHAQITAETIIIRGEHHGNISASKAIEIRGKGKLYGDIKTPSLIVDAGVIFEGNSIMTGQEKIEQVNNKIEETHSEEIHTDKKQATA